MHKKASVCFALLLVIAVVNFKVYLFLCYFMRLFFPQTALTIYLVVELVFNLLFFVLFTKFLLPIDPYYWDNTFFTMDASKVGIFVCISCLIVSGFFSCFNSIQKGFFLFVLILFLTSFHFIYRKLSIQIYKKNKFNKKFLDF